MRTFFFHHIVALSKLVWPLALSLIYFTSMLNCSCNLPPDYNEEGNLDSLAAKYVRLLLQIGQYDADFVDAYYGPAEWKPSVNVNPTGSIPDSLFEHVQSLILQIDEIPIPAENLDIARLQMLSKQCKAIATKLACSVVKDLPLTKKLKGYTMLRHLTLTPSILIDY